MSEERLRQASVTFIVLLALASTASPQERPRTYIFAGGGIVLPVVPPSFHENWQPGFDITAGVGHRFNEILSVQATVGYDRFTFDDEAFDRPGRTHRLGAEPTEIVSISGELKGSFNNADGKISPYVLGAGGIAHVSRIACFSCPFDDLLLVPFDLFLDPRFLDPRFLGLDMERMSETRPMIAFGGGVDIPVSVALQIFVEGRYQLTFTKDDATGHATVRGGVRFGL